jgi:transcriptional regulator GlxA family with amidase domain
VFGDANWLYGGDLAYEVNIISSGPERVVQSHLGTPLNTDQTYRECRGPIDTLLVAGFDLRQEIRFEKDFLNWLREHSGKSRRFVRAPLCWLQLGCSMAGVRPLTGTGATISRETTR